MHEGKSNLGSDFFKTMNPGGENEGWCFRGTRADSKSKDGKFRRSRFEAGQSSDFAEFSPSMAELKYIPVFWKHGQILS